MKYFGMNNGTVTKIFLMLFRNSCVWYFRQVIDEIGPDMMQKELENLNMEIAIFLIGQVS